MGGGGAEFTVCYGFRSGGYGGGDCSHGGVCDGDREEIPKI